MHIPETIGRRLVAIYVVLLAMAAVVAFGITNGRSASVRSDSPSDIELLTEKALPSMEEGQDLQSAGRMAWPWNESPVNPPEDYVAPYDPLFVQNLAVVDPVAWIQRESAKRGWLLEGISETWQEVKVFDEDANFKGIERRLIREAWFVGKRRPYGEGDRLTGTLWVIEKIFIDPRTGESGVILRGQDGERLRKVLPPPDRGLPIPEPEDD